MAGRMWRFYERANDVVRTFTGPAQLGAGHPEEPDVRRADAACPLCGKPLDQHRIERFQDSRTSTRIHCP
jgi:DNA repair exonuclease SbcCD ATPase subunit